MLISQYQNIVAAEGAERGCEYPMRFVPLLCRYMRMISAELVARIVLSATRSVSFKPHTNIMRISQMIELKLRDYSPNVTVLVNDKAGG